MNRRDTIAEAVLNSRDLVNRYLVGFTENNHTAAAAHLPNHVAWSLGHMAQTMHRVAEKLDGRPLPVEDFHGPTPGKSPRAGGYYDPESVCYGSTPMPDQDRYPMYSRCLEIFGAAVDRLAAAVRSVDDSRLDHKTKWGQGETTLGVLAARMVFHNGVHTGQIADLRRALGLGSIFK